MRAKKLVASVVSVLLPRVLFGCASPRAPRGWLPDAGEAQKEAYGAWISVEYDNVSSEQVLDGEFIAVGDDSIFVLTRDRLIAVPVEEIKRGRLTTYDPNHGLLALWTVGGSISTPSHGWFLVASLPVWIISGSIATVAQSYAPIEKFPADSWDDLRKYARFPDGLPEGLNRKALKSK